MGRTELDAPALNKHWMDSFIPYSIVTGTIGILVQLRILDLGGRVLEVGLAITLFSAVAIPSAIFWGSVADRLRARRPTIVASFLAVGLVLILFLLAKTVPEVWILYAIYSFINAAPTTPINLLIMESEPKSRWASSYARYNVITGIGNVIGLAVSSIWAIFVPSEFLVVFLSLNSIVSAFVALRLITEPAFLFEGAVLVKQYKSMLRLIASAPVMFFRTPQLVSVLRRLRYDLTGELRPLYISLLLFYVATGLFSGSFVSLLRSKSMTDSVIFATSMTVLVVQVVSFRYVGPRVERRSFRKHTVLSVAVRSSCMALIGVLAYFVTGVLFMIPVLALYALSMGVMAGVYYTVTTTMIYDSIGVEEQGSSLGVYTAFTGVSTTLGTFASGFLSFDFGYPVAFFASAAGFAISAVIILGYRFASTLSQ